MPVQQITISNIDSNAFSQAYQLYKNSMTSRRPIIVFHGILDISEDNSFCLFGRLLVEDRVRSVIFRNLPLNPDNVRRLFCGIKRAFVQRYPNGVSSHGVTITSPQIELFDQGGDGVHFTIMLGLDVYEAITR